MAKKLYLIALLLIVISLFILVQPNLTGNLAQSGNAVPVKKVVDGDTIKLSDGENVRFLNIDTPERGQYYWKEATNRMKQLVENMTVTLEPDKTNRDKYGRLLRYVYANDSMLNLIMVKEGYARSYFIAPDDKHLDEILEAEKYAKERGLGIWQYDNITDAFCIWVYDMKDDPKGRDEENLNGEYVVLRNSCTHPVNMAGWIMESGRSYKFSIPDFTIESKKTVSIHSGAGTANSTDIYWNSGKAVWRNEHDTIHMYNSQKQLVLNYTY